MAQQQPRAQDNRESLDRRVCCAATARSATKALIKSMGGALGGTNQAIERGRFKLKMTLTIARVSGGKIIPQSCIIGDVLIGHPRSLTNCQQQTVSSSITSSSSACAIAATSTAATPQATSP